MHDDLPDLERIFLVLYQYGADPDAVDPHLGCVVSDYYHGYPVARFLVRK